MKIRNGPVSGTISVTIGQKRERERERMGETDRDSNNRGSWIDKLQFDVSIVEGPGFDFDKSY